MIIILIIIRIALFRGLFRYKSTFIPPLRRLCKPPGCCSPKMSSGCGSTMDQSRAFRRELTVRVASAKCGWEPFTPVYNTTNDLKSCCQCGKQAPKMKHCSGCHWARYCHRECQKADWQNHRKDCCPDRCLPAGIRTIPYGLTTQKRKARG